MFGWVMTITDAFFLSVLIIIASLVFAVAYLLGAACFYDYRDCVISICVTFVLLELFNVLQKGA